MRLAYDAAAPGAALGGDGLYASCVAGAWLEHLAEEVVAGRYRPAPLRRLTVTRKGRPREVGVPTTADQVLVAAWKLWGEPRLDPQLAGHVWGFRPGRDRFGAVRSLRRAVLPTGGRLIRCDIRKMFESLDHTTLAEAAARTWGWTYTRPSWWHRFTPPWRRPSEAGGLARRLMACWLNAWSPGVGVPTGVAVSPAWSNAYLSGAVDGCLSRLMAEGRVTVAMRYADDFALVAPDETPLRDLEQAVRACGLRLHPDKTEVHRVGVEADWPARVLGVDLAPGLVDGALRLVLVDPAGAPQGR